MLKNQFKSKLLLSHFNCLLRERSFVPYNFRNIFIVGLFLGIIPNFCSFPYFISLYMTIGWAIAALWYRIQENIDSRLKKLEDFMLEKLDDSPETNLYDDFKYNTWAKPEWKSLNKLEPVYWGISITLIALIRAFICVN